MGLTVPPIFETGLVTQGTNINTAVTLNEQCGVITTVAVALGANTNDTFTLNNSFITATNLVLVSVVSIGAATAGTGNVTVQGQNQRAGAIDIVLSNSDNQATASAIFKIAFMVFERNGSLLGPPLYDYGVVNQTNNIAEPVVQNTQSGKIVTQATGAIGAANGVAFTFTNSFIKADSIILMNLAKGGSVDADTSANVLIGKSVTNGSMQINYVNAGTAATPNASVDINYLILDPLGNNLGLQSPPIFTTGTVTQTTNIGTDVTQNTQAGVITTVSSTLGPSLAETFKLINNQINANSRVFVFLQDYSGGTPGDGIPQVSVTGIAAGECTIIVANTDTTGTGSALNGTLDIGFLVL